MEHTMNNTNETKKYYYAVKNGEPNLDYDHEFVTIEGDQWLLTDSEPMAISAMIDPTEFHNLKLTESDVQSIDGYYPRRYGIADRTLETLESATDCLEDWPHYAELVKRLK